MAGGAVLGNETNVSVSITGQIDPSLAQSVNSAGQTLEDLEESADDAGSSLGGLEESTDSAGQGADGFSDSMGQAGGAVDNFAQIMVATAILDKLGEFYDRLMDCSAAAGKYETSLKKVETIADTSSTSMRDISNDIMELSNDTGIAASGLSEATYQAISASVDTASSVGFVNDANKLAVGGFTDASAATDVLTTALNAYGLSADNASQISDYLITTQNKGKTTVSELASSIGRIIPVAAAYNVEMDNLSTSLAIMTAGGIQTAEAATYIKSMLNELSDTSSDVSEILAGQTGKSFAELSSGGKSLGDVIQILGDSVEGSTTALSNMWGSAEAGTAALSLYNAGIEKYNSVLNEMESSTGATEKAYQTMTETVEFSQQRMDTTFENLQIAIGDKLNPVIGELYDKVSGIAIGVQDFIEESPDSVAAITSIATAIGTVAAAVVAYSAAIHAASLLKNFLAPGAGWVALAGAIAGVVVGIAEYIELTDKSIDVTERLTFESRETEAELESLEKKYDEACGKYGKNSEEANKLAFQLETLRQEYDASKKTIGEFTEEITTLSESVSETYNTYSENMETAQNLSDGSMFLVSSLAALKGQSELTEAQIQTMSGVVEKLNTNYSELGLTIDSTTGKLNYSVEDLFKFISDTEEVQKQEEALKALTDSMHDFSTIAEDKVKAQEEVEKARENYNKKSEEWAKAHPVLVSIGVSESLSGDVMEAYKDYSKAEENLGTANGAYTESIDKLKEYAAQLGYTEEETEQLIDSLKNNSVALEENAQKTKKAGSINEEYARGMDAAKDAAGEVSSRLKEVAESYDDMFDKAYQNIDAQISLFGEYETKTKLTTGKMMSAWKSQEKYLKRYTGNIKEASKAGLDESMLKELSNGSQEAAGQLDKIVKKYKEIEKSDGKKAAKKWIKEFNKQFQEVEKSKEGFSKTMAGMETDFKKRTKNIVSDLKDTVKDMDMSGTAGAAAEATMNAYINAIKNKTAEAVSEASSMAEAVENAMFAGSKISTRKGKKYTKKHNNTNGYIPVPEAEGDILTEPTLAWIAEAGYDEAAIPINNSERSKALWEETGRRLGMFKKGNNRGAAATLGRLENAGGTSNGNNTGSMQNNIEIPFSPVINIYGNAGGKEIKEAGREIKLAYKDFEKYFKRYLKENKRRTTG